MTLRSIVVTTIQFLGRVHRDIERYTQILPAGTRKDLAVEVLAVVDYARQDYEGFIASGAPDDQIEFLSRFLTDSIDQATKFFYPIFETPETSAVINNLNFSILRFSPPGTKFLCLLPSTLQGFNFGTQMFHMDWAWDTLISPTRTKPRLQEDPLKFFITYPQPLGDDLLSLTVLGHEITHVWYTAKDAATQVSPLIRLDDVALATISNRFGYGDGSIEQSNYFLGVQEKAAYWAEEIICDIVATHLFGPVQLLAFERTVQLSGGHEAGSDTHPDTRWRCSIMLTRLAAVGFPMGGAGQNALSGLTTELAEMALNRGYTPQFNDGAERVIYDAINKAIPDIVNLVRATVGANQCTFVEALANVPGIVSSFEKGFVISDQWMGKQGNQELDTRWLLIALWETYLRQKSDYEVSARELQQYEMNLATQFARAIAGAETLALWRTRNVGSYTG